MKFFEICNKINRKFSEILTVGAEKKSKSRHTFTNSTDNSSCCSFHHTLEFWSSFAICHDFRTRCVQTATALASALPPTSPLRLETGLLEFLHRNWYQNLPPNFPSPSDHAKRALIGSDFLRNEPCTQHYGEHDIANWYNV
jgi:hypothetical protein